MKGRKWTKKNFIRVFVFAIFFSFTQLLGTVVHAPNLDLLEKYIKDLDENALVVFDVDYTLLVPDDCILTPAGEKYRLNLMKKHRDLHGKGDVLESKILLQAKMSLVDKKILSILERLKQKNIKVIALTARSTGRCGLISNAEQWSVQQLASVGINLDWSFPKMDSIVLKDFEGKKTLPIFKRGILFSARYPKGQVLSAFLKKMQWKPSKVFFIDDRMIYIDSVESELDKENIKHVSFYYTAAADQAGYLDQKIADFQFDYLMQQGVWLSDEEVKSKIMKEQSYEQMLEIKS